LSSFTSPPRNSQASPIESQPLALDLTDDEAPALSALLKRTIAADPFPRSPRLEPLNSILGKIQPPAAKSPPLPPFADRTTEARPATVA
jgi:hypothetical protein